jgi:hypothetical protein
MKKDASSKFFEKNAIAADPADTRPEDAPSWMVYKGVSTYTRDGVTRTKPLVDRKASYYGITMNFPKPMEEPMKKAAHDSYMSITEYVTDLILKDLENRGIKPDLR